MVCTTLRRSAAAYGSNTIVGLLITVFRLDELIVTLVRIAFGFVTSRVLYYGVLIRVLGGQAEAIGPTVTSTLCTLVLSPMSDLRPGFSTFTFRCPASCLGQRPLCESATPRGKVSVKVTRITRRPVSFATSAWSPSARPRPAASAGCIAIAAGPTWAAILATFEKLS